MNSFVKAFAAVTVGLFAPQHVAAADEITTKEKMILLPSADAIAWGEGPKILLQV